MNDYEEMINSIVKEHFGVYVFRSDQNPDAVCLSFLPRELFFTIIHEYQSTFIMRYNKFIMWVHDKLGIQQILAKYQYDMISETMFESIKQDLSRVIYKYNCDGEIPLDKVIIAFLNLDDYIPISKFN
jgi:hypothetical protein